MEQPSNKFKINKNAKQLHANGVFIMIDKRNAPHLNNLVLVEGGPKVIKKYKKLMLRRIKWASSTQDAEDENEDEEMTEVKASVDRKCNLIWEGVVNEPMFPKFRAVYDVRVDADARKIFQERNAEWMWEAALNFQVSRAIGEIDNQEKLY